MSNAEAISRLIVNDVLLIGERQLFPKQEQFSEEPENGSSQSAAAPITHNDKATASVLLTLLDEQLDASVAETANRSGVSTSTLSRGSDAAPSSNRIAAQYAEEAVVFRANPAAQEPAISPGANSQQMALAVTSPELQTFIQRFLMSAAARIQADGSEDLPRGTRKRNVVPLADSLSMTRIAGATLAIAVLAIVIAVTFAR
jgi:hypothetical protein